MYKAIRQYLLANSQISRWFQPYVADKNTEKPYGVIDLQNENESKINHRGKFQGLVIWLYHKRGKSDVLYDLGEEIVEVLSEQIIEDDGEQILIGKGRLDKEFPDDALDCIGRRVIFKIPKIR